MTPGVDTAPAGTRLLAPLPGHLPDDPLIVSGPACAALAAESDAVVRLSAWEGNPIDPGTLVLADEPGWLRPLSPRLRALHFQSLDADLLWQALAAGAIVSMATVEGIASPRVAEAIVQVEDENDVIATWKSLCSDAELYERSARAVRSAYGAEGRLAADNAAELIERVCRWQ